jgi:hypothetical protein
MGWWCRGGGETNCGVSKWLMQKKIKTGWIKTKKGYNYFFTPGRAKQDRLKNRIYWIIKKIQKIYLPFNCPAHNGPHARAIARLHVCTETG